MEVSEKLLRDLEESGYGLLRSAETDPNELLFNVARSSEGRVQEGFPVLVANMLLREDQRLNLATVHKKLRKKNYKRPFLELVGYTLDLFYTYGVEDLANKLEEHLKQHRLWNSVKKTLGELNSRRGRLDPERLRNAFVNYFLLAVREQRAKEKQRVNEELQCEHYLSLLFSPKQKDLVMKKLRGEKLNKTEREYFSRVVKKRLQAVTDPDVHRLALKALQQ